jgi:hypothetical protein
MIGRLREDLWWAIFHLPMPREGETTFVQFSANRSTGDVVVRAISALKIVENFGLRPDLPSVNNLGMTQKRFSNMKPEAKARWLNEVSPTDSWAPGDDVFCLHCDAVFKAEDVACDDEGDPTCPVCHSSTPLDFHHLPWWREDLCKEVDTDEQHSWKVDPIHATPGKPSIIPRPDAK